MAEDFAFAFDVKRQALEPYINQRWGWDTETQLAFHQKRGSEKAWQIIQLSQNAIGTVSIERRESEFQFGEFYLSPKWQCLGIGAAGILATLLLKTAGNQP